MFKKVYQNCFKFFKSHSQLHINLWHLIHRGVILFKKFMFLMKCSLIETFILHSTFKHFVFFCSTFDKFWIVLFYWRNYLQFVQSNCWFSYSTKSSMKKILTQIDFKGYVYFYHNYCESLTQNFQQYFDCKNKRK